MGVVALPLAIVAGCGDQGAPNASAVAKACLSTTNMTDELCSCIGDEAEEKLSADGMRFLTALLEGDEDETAELRGQLGLEEVAKAGMFMTTAPATCAARLAR